jgi:DNA-binding IclR family transcriptional regulator
MPPGALLRAAAAADAAPVHDPSADEHPRSPLRTVQVLHALAVAGRGMPLAELAGTLQLPKTSLFRLLRALEDGGYVQSSQGVHRLGPQALKLGAALVRGRQLSESARPALERLAESCAETVILGTFDDSRTQIVYTVVIEPDHPLRFSIRPGLTKPLYSSATGQVLLSWMPAAEREAYLDGVALERLASGTVRSVTALRRKLRDIRGRGVAVSVDGMFDGVYSIAAPVFDAGGQVPAGVSISAPSSRGAAQEERFSQLLTRTCAEVSSLLGHAGHAPAPGASSIP